MSHEGIVYIVDDEEPIRKALSLLMKSVGREAMVYASAGEFLDDYEPDNPACLVLDVRMPGMSGLELQEKLISRGINIPIIFMTANGDIPMTVRAMKSGASDFIEKPFNNQMLLDRIQESLDKEIQGWEERKQNLDAIERLSILTSREREVMALVVQGMLNKQIAAELDISIRTVESHRANIMEKLGVKSVSQLVRISLEEQ